MKKNNYDFFVSFSGYKLSILVVLCLMIFGLLVDLIMGQQNVPLMVYPYNLYVGALFIVLLWVIKKGKTNLFYWMSSIPAAISSVVLYFIAVLMMGIIPADKILKIGISDVSQSWFFLIVNIYFLLILGSVVIRKLVSIRFKNIGFLSAHLGLWLIVFAAYFGNGDISIIKVQLYKGQRVKEGWDEKNMKTTLPFAMWLETFEVEEYLPKIGLYDIQRNRLVMNKMNDDWCQVDTLNKTGVLANWEVKVLLYEPFANCFNGDCFKNKQVGAVHALKILLKNKDTGHVVKGWVSSGSFLTEPRMLQLDKRYAVVMFVPDKKAFSSRVHLYCKNGEAYEAVIAVNAPVTVDGWKIYQFGYDRAMDRWSNMSVLQLVKDPWLPVVYSGILMMMLGALFMFWNGNLKRKI